jgi:hypothetical protein
MGQLVPAPKEVPMNVIHPCAAARLRRGLPLALVSFLAACGGGGGGGAPPPTLAAGPYHSVTFKGLHGSPDTLRTHVGTFVSNGIDRITDAGSTVNENGVISADPGGPVVPYSLSPDGVLSLHDGLGTEHFRGGLTLDGKMMGVAAVLPLSPSEVALTLGLTKGSGLSDATLAGDYHYCYFGAGAGSHFGVVGTAAFDGIGGVGLGTTLANRDGGISGLSFGLGTYGVAADGTFTLGSPFRGGVSEGGDRAIAGGGVTTDSFNQIWVFIRKATTAAIGTLLGTYTIVGVGYGLSDGKYYDMAGSVSIEGDGHCTLSVTVNREGVLDSRTSSSLYTVAADGTLEFTDGLSGHTFRGAISADGTLGMLGGGSSAGSDPSFSVIFRR